MLSQLSYASTLIWKKKQGKVPPGRQLAALNECNTVCPYRGDSLHAVRSMDDDNECSIFGGRVKYFADAKCERMPFGHCEIFCLRRKWNEINPLTRRRAFHMAKPYFTPEGHFINPVRDLFHWKKDFTKVKSFFLEATPRIELGNQSFADSCLTAWLCLRVLSVNENYYITYYCICQ